MIDKFTALVVMLVSQVYTYFILIKLFYVKNVQLFVCQSYINKVV